MTVPDFLSHLPKPLPIRDLRVFLRSRSFKWGTVTMMGDKFSNNFIRSYQVFQMGDKLSDIFIRLLCQVFQIGDAQPPQKAHIGAQVFQTSLLV